MSSEKKMSPQEYKSYVQFLERCNAIKLLEKRIQNRTTYLVTIYTKLRKDLKKLAVEFKNEEFTLMEFEIKFIVNTTYGSTSPSEENLLNVINSQIRAVENFRMRTFEMLFQQGFIYMPDGSLKQRS